MNIPYCLNKIEQSGRFDYSFFANFADYAETAGAIRVVAAPGGSNRNEEACLKWGERKVRRCGGLATRGGLYAPRQVGQWQNRARPVKRRVLGGL
jgi:hypothetical protein